MSFFQTGTPDTSGMMLLGFAVIFGVLALHLLSFYLRARNLKRDLDLLEDFDKD